MEKYETYIGVDPSLTGTAVCAIDNSGEIQKVTTIDTAKMRGFDRLLHISEAVFEFLFENAAGEHLVAVEGFSFGSRGRSMFDLGMLGGILRMGFFTGGVPFVDIPPTSLKKFVTGSGNAGKPKMLEMTFRNFDVGSEILKDDNQVDAFGLAQFARAYVQETKQKDKKRQEALNKVAFEIIRKRK